MAGKDLKKVFIRTAFPLLTFSDSATNPASPEEDWDAINKFCDQVNNELEGPQYAVRLLAHKIQSPIERESLYALSVSKTTLISSCI